jgi:hypothetical protein
MKRHEEDLPVTHSEDAANEAANALTRLFSSREIANKAHFRCSIDGPTDSDVLFESVLDDVFGRDAGSDYKRWVRRLYRLGLIPKMPRKWKTSKHLENLEAGSADQRQWQIDK